ncbi:MAG: hypothetical protein KME21_28940 [Desmonostoc vinosum HA7617-LM4]|nr:hypothetical protein [Desmonostoc vinosum HA7617-LM4]
MNNLTLEQALTSDNRTGSEVLLGLENIFDALVEFKNTNPQTFEFFCANSGESTLTDAIGALAQALEVLEEG